MAEERQKSERAKKEEQILERWKQERIFEQTLEKESPEGEFVFYEGPPTANGRPGIHHLEARAFKDAVPRYKTMRGYCVRRKGGWDTHGLPVELEVEKKLGLKSKKEIEEYGVEKFNEHCRESVWTYANEWKEFTERMGYWVDLDDPYITYKPEYVESVWNIMKGIHEQGLLYKDYKVVPWCPRCGTALSSHELAQGYETVKDLSVTVEFKIKGEKSRSLLAWTTTPWTLPGNVALAVGESIDYVEIEKKDEEEGALVTFILAKDRLESVFSDDEYEVIKEMKGKDLMGLEYEPPYPFLKDQLPEDQKENLGKAFKVYAADFVTTEDGTGIVHTAVMYGQDDFELGTKVGLPKHHLVDQNGTFVSSTDFLGGRFVKDEEVAVDIIKDLAHRGLLFSKEKYEHTYPFCWRCKTPLIYYARDSWYIRMSDLRDKLVSENEKINWEPEYIKEGRFGEWLREVKDWAISRERYWGTPLPIWMSEDGSEMDVIGSFDELVEKAPDRFSNVFVMRHGESEKNTQHMYDDSLEKYGLTDTGREEVQKAITHLKDHGITKIYTSPVRRTKETAEMVAQELGCEVVVDDRLKEVDSGSWDGKRIDDESFKEEKQTYTNLAFDEFYAAKRGGGESWQDVDERARAFIQEVILKEKSAVLVVTHGGPLAYTLKYLNNLSPKETHSRYLGENSKEFAVPHRVVLDRERGAAFDPHKPFVDDIVYDKNGKEMKRISEVMDVWFDSGAMPFAQDHYPFDKFRTSSSSEQELKYPADFIAEAIDQTRGWFYTLHAVGVLMGKGLAYKNVISLGHILDEEGRKMSKSKGNTVNPWDMMDTYGVDALRFWMYAVNQPGEPKNFDEKTVDEVVKKVFNLLLNVVTFYEMADADVAPSSESPHVLDRWVVERLNQLQQVMTENMEQYKLLEATRAIREFIADLSQWYIRRSRDRFKEGDEQALGTTRYVLLKLSKLIAPFMPFLAEEVYGRVGGKKASVHLEDWPEGGEVDQKLLDDMVAARDLVSQVLEIRAKENIKVRQPLSLLTVPKKLSDELFEVIAEEVNVKKVEQGAELALDTEITPELQREGDMRELVRAIQALRKESNLNPDDEIKLTIQTDEFGQKLFEEFRDDILRPTNVSDISFADILQNSAEQNLGGQALVVDTNTASFTILLK